ncbi:MAG: CHAD domain-containing protein [Campylobacterales bacterium]|nr:CHAD domain-containing protein [Campylobacterales bacterium]
MQQNELTRYLVYQLYHAGLILREMAPAGNSDDIHEFRVALRRIRSLIKLYLKTSIGFPAQLKAAVKATNPLRELDVLIESLDPSEYPKTYKRLKQMRHECFKEIFRQDFKKKTLQELHHYYDLLCGAHIELSANHLMQTVEHRYEQSLSTYEKVDENTSQKKLHALRVEFKNSRYGFEFLRASGLSDEAGKIGQCKKFQNTLGAVQDAYNQIEWLKTLYRKHPLPETLILLEKRKKELKKLKAASRRVQSGATEGTRSSG